MRTKKALKQLRKAETLRSAVAHRYTPSTPHLQELLDSASTMIGQAKSELDGQAGPSARKSAQPTKKQVQFHRSEAAATPEFAGNKTDFVRALVEARGLSGAVPKDIDEAFTARQIDRSKNLIYNALSTLVKQKKLKKKADRYFSASMDSHVKIHCAKEAYQYARPQKNHRSKQEAVGNKQSGANSTCGCSVTEIAPRKQSYSSPEGRGQKCFAHERYSKERIVALDGEAARALISSIVGPNQHERRHAHR